MPTRILWRLGRRVIRVIAKLRGSPDHDRRAGGVGSRRDASLSAPSRRRTGHASALTADRLHYATGTARSSKHFLNIELPKDQQVIGAITA